MVTTTITTSRNRTPARNVTRRVRPAIRAKRVAIAVGAWIGSLVLFFPIAYMVLKSFQTEQVAASSSPQLIFTPTIAAYSKALGSGFWDYALNSLLVTGISTVIVLILAVPAAYALSIRPVEKAQDVLFFFISTKMLPIAAGIIPIYYIASQLGVLNTVGLLVVMHLGMNLPLGIWMIRSFMLDIPPEVLEAAAVDGASQRRTLLSIILPLIRPGLASTALLCIVFSWNEYFFAVNLTSSTSTLPLFLQKFLSFGQLTTAQVAAVAILVSLPVIIIGWIAQRSFVRGLLFGAVR